MPAPAPAQQVEFLVDLQRLLGEGSFVASYKYALLIALARVAVERGDDSGDPLVISVADLSEQFIRLYWRQTAPYVPARGPRRVLAAESALPYGPARGQVLRQNTGRQASILEAIAAARASSAGSLAALKTTSRAWRGLASRVARTIKLMPLWRLQTIGRQKVEFLYTRGEDEDHLVLLPGVAFCLRRFHGLVEDLVQGAWIRFLRRIPENALLIGEANDLDGFLFGTERASLGEHRAFLTELQAGRCFYCQGALRNDGEVDHFIPWARYSYDLAHNFVLAHGACNLDKSDRLAAVEHLARWCERNALHAAHLEASFLARRLDHDLDATLQITRWGYAQAESARSQVWVRRKDVLQPLTPAWRTLPGLHA